MSASTDPCVDTTLPHPSTRLLGIVRDSRYGLLQTALLGPSEVMACTGIDSGIFQQIHRILLAVDNQKLLRFLPGTLELAYEIVDAQKQKLCPKDTWDLIFLDPAVSAFPLAWRTTPVLAAAAVTFLRSDVWEDMQQVISEGNSEFQKIATTVPWKKEA